MKPSTVIRFFFLFYCANESMVWIISCRWGTLSSVEIKGTVKAISRSLNSQCRNPKQFNTFSHPFAAALRKARERLLMQVCVTQDISDLLWSNFRAATSIDNIQSSQFYLWVFFTTLGTNTEWCTGSLVLPDACWFESRDTSLKPVYALTLEVETML